MVPFYDRQGVGERDDCVVGQQGGLVRTLGPALPLPG